MRLKDYLYQNEIQVRQMAKAVGMSNGYASSVVMGKKPSKRLAKDISVFTKGEVTVGELMGEIESPRLVLETMLKSEGNAA